MAAKQEKYFFNAYTYEQLVFTILSRECSKLDKELFEFNSYKKQHTIDMDFLYFNVDAYAPNGVYDNIPTFVEVIGGHLTKFVLDRMSQLIESFLVFKDQDYKLLIICQASESELEDKSALFKTKLKNLKTSNDYQVEIWWGTKSYRISQLLRKYPIETKSYREANVFEQISIFDDLDEITDEPINEETFEANNNDVIQEFRKLLSANRVSLVLGTGVSIPYNKLTWNKLIDKLYSKLYPKDRFNNKRKTSKAIGGNNLSISQYIRDKLNVNYSNALFSALYPKRMKPPYGRTSLEAVCDLIGRGRVKKALTYNYDDFFEKTLTSPSEVLYNKEDYLSGKFPIYHVHGYLPSSCPVNMRDDYCKTIVLTEEEYFDCYSNPTNWPVAIQLETFKDDSCLFVGNSITDYNEKHLLNKTKQQFKHHYAVMFKNGLGLNDLLKVYSYYENILNVRIIWANNPSDMINILDSF